MGIYLTRKGESVRDENREGGREGGRRNIRDWSGCSSVQLDGNRRGRIWREEVVVQPKERGNRAIERDGGANDHRVNREWDLFSSEHVH